MGKCASKRYKGADRNGFDYDLIVIGGGSGGLSAAKQAGKDGKLVIVCDFVQPSPIGSTWGLGGTCTNVGCVPKKLLHEAGIISETLSMAPAYGFQMDRAMKKLTPFKFGVEHNWTTLIEEVQGYIHKQNWSYRTKLNDANVQYLNAYAEFEDSNTLGLTHADGQKSRISGSNILLAIGCRPKYLNIPGGKRDDALCISSDDIFSIPYPPGKTLIVGASYIALECAGFLVGLGFDVTIMVRSIFLRGFDQEMAEKVAAHIVTLGVRILREYEPTQITKIEDGTPPRLQVLASGRGGKPHDEVYNTILLAIGREPMIHGMRLEKKGKVALAPSGKIAVNDADQTNVRHIYAVGDCADGRPELATVAIHSGKSLAKRLFSNSSLLTNYVNVPTTIFTPLEYGCVGMSEDTAIDKYGPNGIIVYYNNFQPLEDAIPGKIPDTCFVKLICLTKGKEEIVGLHYLGPNAGEVVQGFALAFKFRATKADYDDTIGIHPTCAERFTTLTNIKGSGEAGAAESC